MSSGTATVERNGRSAVVHLHGDVAIATAGEIYGQLRAVCRRRDVSERRPRLLRRRAGRLRRRRRGVARRAASSSAPARRSSSRELADHHRAALDLLARPRPCRRRSRRRSARAVRAVRRRVLGTPAARASCRGSSPRPCARASRSPSASAALPAGSLSARSSRWASTRCSSSALLCFLLGMTIAFQGAVQLQRVRRRRVRRRHDRPVDGARVRAADDRDHPDRPHRRGDRGRARHDARALRDRRAARRWAINPVRFLVVPRIAAITFVGPR